MLTGMDIFSTNCVALRHKGDLQDTIRTLPKILGDEGYETVCVGFKGNAASCEFQNYLEFKGRGGREEGCLRKAECLNEVASPELDHLAKSDKPFFMMLRHMDPHSPYMPPSPYDRMFYHGNECDPANTSMEPIMNFKPFSDFFASWMPGGISDKDFVIAQYDGAIAYMGTCIQRLINHECWFDHHGIYDVPESAADHPLSAKGSNRSARDRIQPAQGPYADSARTGRYPDRYPLRRAIADAVDRGTGSQF